MIIFDLICEHEHRFEGWFQNAEDFSRQKEQGLLECPRCGSKSVQKLPSAVSIASARFRNQPETMTEEREASPAVSTIISRSEPHSATQLIGLYRQFSQKIMALSEDVGDEFAAEARRIHYHQSPERLIRGQVSDQEHESLIEEGIGVMRLPVFNETDLN